MVGSSLKILTSRKGFSDGERFIANKSANIASPLFHLRNLGAQFINWRVSML